MSYILEALKKSEQMRRRNQALSPAITVEMPLQTTPKRSRSPWLAGALLLLCALVFTYINFKGGSDGIEPAEPSGTDASLATSLQTLSPMENDSTSKEFTTLANVIQKPPRSPDMDKVGGQLIEPDSPVEETMEKTNAQVQDASSQMPGHLISPPSSPMLELAAKQKPPRPASIPSSITHKSTTAPLGTISAPEKNPKPASISAYAPKEEAPKKKALAPITIDTKYKANQPAPEVQEIKEKLATIRPIETPEKGIETQEALSIPLLQSLSTEFQESLVELNINVHVYSDDPEKRFVIINMKKYSPGEYIKEGPLLENITAHNLILSHQGRVFRIPRP